MHPGFYYYVAAECTERRRERFLDAVVNEVFLIPVDIANGNKANFDLDSCCPGTRIFQREES